MATKNEIAWAAGLFEGEGHVRTTAKLHARQMCFGLGMTDRDVVERFQAIVGCGTIRCEDRSHLGHKNVWRWSAGRRADTRRLYKLLRPWMGKRRGSQMDESFEAETAAIGVGGWQRAQTHCRHGHPYDEANTYRGGGYRSCRICSRAASIRYRKRKKAEA